ncbi:hypothetical protein EJD97_013573 [Solanum chilense]|uniref:Putative plant transposon protein domain-containing protein n=1 Tax=Solanum chilense TaxID=4083 RepID=A0A6N2C837_SOLCI|nr:hypothetical protein EJD97_013573 [Solanum chilense]
MAPKKYQVYSRVHSKSVAPSARLVIGSEDERDSEYVHQSHYHEDGARQEVSGSEEVSRSEEASAPATTSQSTSFDEANSADSTPAPLIGVPTPVADQPNQWRKLLKEGWFMREPELRETIKRWIAQYLSIDGETADWVWETKGSIKKANLTFTAKFMWLIVRHCLSPIGADNIVTWDHPVLMAAMIAGFKVDFAWLLHAVMYEKAFQVTTTYPFPIMIKTPPGTIDIGLIRDEANELAPHRGPRVDVPLLGENLADTVEQAQAASQATFEPTNTTTVESISGGSTATSSYHSTPSTILVPLARVQKLESQMSTLLHHIQPWMQRLMKSLREDLDTILEARVPESESPSAEPAEDTILTALFSTAAVSPPPPREPAKRCRGLYEVKARAQNRER